MLVSTIIACILLCVIFYWASARMSVACIDVSGSMSPDMVRNAIKMAWNHGHKYISFFSWQYTKPVWFSWQMRRDLLENPFCSRYVPLDKRGGGTSYKFTEDPCFKNKHLHLYTDYVHEALPSYNDRVIHVHMVWKEKGDVW